MKEKTKLIIILTAEFIAVSIVLLLIFLAGKKSYTVTFDLNGGVLLSGDLEQRVMQGQNATPPSTAKEGHYLMGWAGSYHKVTSNTTVRAIWEYETTPGIEYEDSSNKNYSEIIGSHKELQGDIYIGAYHDGKLILGIKEEAFKSRDGITAVYLLDGILTIGEEAFAECKNLETIIIPSTVVNIEKNAFSGCESLKNIVLPESLKSIGDGAFSSCVSIEEIEIPDSVISIGAEAFNTDGLVVFVPVDEEGVEKNYGDTWRTDSVTVKAKELPEEDESEEEGKKDKNQDASDLWGILQ